MARSPKLAAHSLQFCCETLLGLLRPLIKGSRDHQRTNALPANLDLHLRPNACESRGYVRQRNILLQERSRRPACDVSDFVPGLIEHLIAIARNPAFDHFQANQRALHTRSLRLLECPATDEVVLLHLDEAV